ncbi:MAG: thioesterase [Moorea sp. SIO2B7]|nr:thioesterase [Moorena sp. SIO2B7]
MFLTNEVTPNPWLISAQRNSETTLRLFCFPPSGAGAFLFRSWCNHLPPQIEVWAVRLPGRENRLREPFFTEIASLVKTLAPILLPYLQDCPFAFFGHSVGALISFELARQLRLYKCRSPLYLFLSARRAAHIPTDYLLHKQSDVVLIEKLRKYGGTPEIVLQSTEMMNLFLPIFRADLTLNETYIYSPESPLDCPMTVFGATEDTVATREQLEQWVEHTCNTFDLQMFPGSHMFFKDRPELLLKTISDRLILSLNNI